MVKTRKLQAFTLVELLVVISIIALLLAILMPALGKARNMARVTTCTANTKQIANVMALYQSDNEGYVPVMLHKESLNLINAKSSFLSIPFMPYSGKPVDLVKVTNGYLNPDVKWTEQSKMIRYFEEYLPKFYVCPYVRGSEAGSGWVNSGKVQVGPGAANERWNYKSVGRNDSYSTWIWPRPKDYDFWPGAHPWGGANGTNKYGNVLWHRAGDPQNPKNCYIDQPQCYARFKDQPVRFSDIRGIAELTAVYCAQGEIDETAPNGRIFNYQSHEKGNKGGTNVMFGDGHVEWVQGSRITAGN